MNLDDGRDLLTDYVGTEQTQTDSLRYALQSGATRRKRSYSARPIVFTFAFIRLAGMLMHERIIRIDFEDAFVFIKSSEYCSRFGPP